MDKVLVIGEPLIRVTPINYQQLHNGVTSQLFYGGSEINVACNLSGFGVPCRVFTALPDSVVGQSFNRFLLNHGIDTNHIVYTKERIGIYYLEEGFGTRQSNVYYDRNHTSMIQLQSEHIRFDELLDEVIHIHVSGITLALGESIQQWVEELLIRAKDKNISVSLDLNWRSKLISLTNAKHLFSKFAHLSDYCFGIEPLMVDDNDDKALFDRQLSSTSALEQRMAMLKEKYQLKAIFHTNRQMVDGTQHYGAYVYSNRLYHSQGYQTQVLERVGSGDAFVSGALYQLLQQANMQDVINFACASGTYKCTIQGDNMWQPVDNIYNIMGGNKDVSR